MDDYAKRMAAQKIAENAVRVLGATTAVLVVYDHDADEMYVGAWAPDIETVRLMLMRVLDSNHRVVDLREERGRS